MKFKNLYLDGTNLEKINKIAKALGSQTRYTIVKLLAKEEVDISTLASILGQTEANVSAQVKYLEKVGILKCKYKPGVHGVRKVCRAQIANINIKLVPDDVVQKEQEKEQKSPQL